MVDQKLLDWINSQKRAGYTEQQIRSHLISQKHNLADVYEALNASKKPIAQKTHTSNDPKVLAKNTIKNIKNVKNSLHKTLMENGLVYAVLFYALLLFYLLPTVASIGVSVYYKTYLGLIYPVVFLSIIGSMLIRKKIMGLLILFFFFNPLIFSILQLVPFIHAFSEMTNITIYVLLSIYLLVIGGIMSFMFNYATDNNIKFLGTGIFANIILSIIFSFNYLFSLGIIKFRGLAQLSEGTDVGAITGYMKYFINLISSEPASTHICFILAFIFFNLPYFIFYNLREKKSYYIFLFYIIPIIIYIGLAYVFSIVINSIMQNPLETVQNLMSFF